MGKPKVGSVLYRLVEAGQLVRQALALPLRAHRLEPGDDAVLFLLRRRIEVSESDLAAALGTSATAIDSHLRRLSRGGLIDRRLIGPTMVPGVSLTTRGAYVRGVLADQWDRLEEALFADMPGKRRRDLRKILERLVALLSI